MNLCFEGKENKEGEENVGKKEKNELLANFLKIKRLNLLFGKKKFKKLFFPKVY